MRGKGGMFCRRVADAFFGNVSLLLHFDGNTNDSSQQANAVSLSGATTDGAARFGSASLSAGSGQYASVAESSSLGLAATDNFTVECWVKTSQNLFDIFCWSAGGVSWGLYADAVLGAIIFAPSGGTGVSGDASGINDNQWHHVALSRTSSTVRIHIDGVKKSESAIPDGDMVTTGSDFFVGVGLLWLDGAFGSSKLIDEFRFTKGYARYGSANFTPPTAAFPDY